MEVDSHIQRRIEPERNSVSATSNSTPPRRMNREQSAHLQVAVSASWSELRLHQAIAERDARIAWLQNQVRQTNPRPTNGRMEASETTEREMVSLQESVARRPEDSVVQLGAHINQMKGESNEKTNLQTALVEASRKVEEVEKRHNEREEDLQKCIAKLEHRIGHFKKRVRALNEHVVALEAQRIKDQTLANYSKVSDDAIKSVWQRMAYSIQNVAATLLTGNSTLRDVYHGHTSMTCAVCCLTSRDFEDLQKDDLRPIIVERIIWRAVCRRVFERNYKGSYSKVWGGVVGETFSNLFQLLLDAIQIAGSDPATLLHWKSESARMIDNIKGTDEDEFQQVVLEEYTGLCGFLPSDNSDLQKDLYQELYKVFDDAVYLHKTFMKSQAHFYIDWAKKPTSSGGAARYNPEYHNAEAWERDLSDESIVLVNIAPSLVKVGNADGNSYDKHIRLIKASVICD